MPYVATLSYIILIVLINTLFAWLPEWHIFGDPVSPMDFFVGVVYIFRDFAQREIQHYIIGAMILGCILSYFLAEKSIAIASMCAFATGEIIDWIIFTWTKKPLSQRLILSSLCSTPVDSLVFLSLAHQLNKVSLLIMILTKCLGVLAIWIYWRSKYARLA